MTEHEYTSRLYPHVAGSDCFHVPVQTPLTHVAFTVFQGIVPVADPIHHAAHDSGSVAWSLKNPVSAWSAALSAMVEDATDWLFGSHHEMVRVPLGSSGPTAMCDVAVAWHGPAGCGLPSFVAWPVSPAVVFTWGE
ncbi:MAG: hypothetical protein JF886_14150 [Candidatus Dormibacteraeota bacterium]|uniref:Uncharacterized protein n=1 Tax=Candidatus Aeolococcus gillhamiae TaxID=3127015 RepID=A0A934N0L5_9BACT|nr:hypothetical protein [Candidatus Dormibacteraeota bacterium]